MFNLIKFFLLHIRVGMKKEYLDKNEFLHHEYT